MVYTRRGKENGKKWRAQRGEKKLEFTLFPGGGMRKTVRDADGRKNRVNTESSDPIPRGWVGEGGIGKEACSVVKAVAWNRNIS